MEVATLTATLEAEVSRFVANMKAADTLLTTLQQQIKETEGESEELSAALKLIKVSERAISSSISQLGKLNTSMETSQKEALDLVGTLKDVKIPEATAAASDAAASQIEHQLDDIKRKAIETKSALGDLGGVSPGFIRAYGPNFGRRAFVAPPVGGYSSPQMQRTDYAGGTDIERFTGDLLALDKVFSNINDRMALHTKYPIYTPFMGPLTRDQYLAQYATPIEGRRLTQIPEEIVSNPLYSFPSASEGELKTRKARSLAYLRSKGVSFDPNALGGMGRFTKSETDDALIAAALGLGEQSGVRKALGFLGWGSGGGIHIPGFGVAGGGGGGRGGFGLFGRNIFGGMAGFGTPLGLAGFGAERALFSSVGILGSLGGGVLGGGLLGMGALGTFAVGAGTNMAGMGQAAGDIKTVSGDLGNLKTAIQEYGKNSTQAANAQLQLNTDLKGFSPIARNAVLAAAQTSQQFKAMFDKLTGPAEKIGANIINQAMQVGEKFLPTIGKFAHQNMTILQSGLQPFFDWLTKGGNAQAVIANVNGLTSAIKNYGVHSSQAGAANRKLMSSQRGVGGLGYFTDLEKVFQKNFPTAIHAGEQGFELFVKTVDLAAQHVGHFMGTLNSFFTRMNHQDFGQWAAMVEKLIGLFHSWLGMFTSFGRLIFDIFKPAVGLGQQFAELMTRIFNQVAGYINQKGTQNILGQLFSVHLVQLIRQIGGLILNLLPIVESIASAFIQVEAVAAKAFGQVINVIKNVFGLLNKVPGLDKFLGWIIAFRIIYKANLVLLGGVRELLRMIPFIGALFGTGASEAQTAVIDITASVDEAASGITAAIDRVMVSIREMLSEMNLIGPTMTKNAAEADTSLYGMNLLGAGGGKKLTDGRFGYAALGEAEGAGFLATLKSGLIRGGTYAIGGLIAGQIIKSVVPGKTGNILGNVAMGAGIGAGIGSVVPVVGTGFGAVLGGLGGGLYSIIKHGPSVTDQLKQMAAAAQQFGRAAKRAAASGDALGAMQLRQSKAKQYTQMAITVKDASQKIIASLKGEAKQLDNTGMVNMQANTRLRESGLALNAHNLALMKAKVVTQNANTATSLFVQKLQSMAGALASSNPQLSLVYSKVAQLYQKLGHMPSVKKITILIHTVFSASFKKLVGNMLTFATNIGRTLMGLPPIKGDPHGHGSVIHIGLPKKIQDAIIAAQDGHGSIVKANKAAYMYYQKQLQQPGLSHAQKMKLYQAQTQYYNAIYGVPGGIPATHDPSKTRAAAALPPHYLSKQQAETAKARIDINKGQYSAALRILALEKRQLEAMLKTAKNQAERTRILSQLATVSGMVKSAKQSLSGIGPNSFALPLALQVQMARADALAALNPNANGPTALQIKLAQKAKAAAMKAIQSHTLSMQQLIDAWNVVSQANSVLAQKLDNKLRTYHVVSTDAITDSVKGLTQAQEMQLREAMAQRDAHRGKAPNQGAVGGGTDISGAGSTPASPHGKKPKKGGKGGGAGGGGGGGGYTTSSGTTTINIDKVEIHGVQNVRQLAAEIDKLARQKYQRAGGRR